MDQGKKLLKDAIQDGFCLKVYYEEDDVAYIGTNLKKAWDEATACDSSLIEFFKKDNQGNEFKNGWAFLVHGNEPHETINDYSIGGYAESWDQKQQA